jgi:hypothetical protein
VIHAAILDDTSAVAAATFEKFVGTRLMAEGVQGSAHCYDLAVVVYAVNPAMCLHVVAWVVVIVGSGESVIKNTTMSGVFV